MSEPSTMGERIRWQRRRLGLSAKQIAGRIGQSESAVRNVENGTNGASLPRARRYAEALGVTPEWLLFGEASGASKGSSVDGAASPPAAPAGSRNGAAPSTVFVKFSGELPIHIAAKVLALLEEGGK